LKITKEYSEAENRRRTYNAMAKRKEDMIYKTTIRKLKIKQHKPH
jgi:hypothetical protein